MNGSNSDPDPDSDPDSDPGSDPGSDLDSNSNFNVLRISRPLQKYPPLESEPAEPISSEIARAI